MLELLALKHMRMKSMPDERKREWTKWDYFMDRVLRIFRLYRETVGYWEKQNGEIDHLRPFETKKIKKEKRKRV